MRSDDGPRYPAREDLPTRGAASVDAVPDEAPTALDSVRFSDDLLAQWGQGAREREAAAPPASAPGPAPVKRDPSRGRGFAPWVLAFVVAVIGGLLGAIVGTWVALR